MYIYYNISATKRPLTMILLQRMATPLKICKSKNKFMTVCPSVSFRLTIFRRKKNENLDGFVRFREDKKIEKVFQCFKFNYNFSCETHFFLLLLLFNTEK